MKVCTKCEEEKPASEYYRDRGKPRTVCKRCFLDHQAKYREANRGYVRELKRSSDARQRVLNHERILEKQRIANAKMRAKPGYRARANARNRVQKAVTSGRFPAASTMVCDHCQEAQAYDWHHHKGYEKEYALDVIALCRVCHREEHA